MYVKIRASMLRIWGVSRWKFCRKIGCSGRGHVKEKTTYLRSRLVVKHATLAAMLQCLNAAWVASHVLTEIPILARTGYVITYPAWLASQLTSKENHHYPFQCLGNDTFQYFNIDPAVGLPRFSYIYFFKTKYHSAWTCIYFSEKQITRCCYRVYVKGK